MTSVQTVANYIVSMLTNFMRRSQINLHYLLHAADMVEERLREQLAPLQVRPRQARIIAALNKMGPVSQVALAREFNITAASMSTMTSRLIAAGFIERKEDPEERRSNLLTLTTKGKGLLDDIIDAWRTVDTIIEDAIGSTQADELAKLTHNLRDALGGHVPGTVKE